MRSIILLATLVAACTPSSTLDAVQPLEPTSADAHAAATSIGAFAADLHAALPKEGNLFYSPTSIALALGIAERGAHGVTKDQMDTVLHAGPSSAQNYAGLMARFTSSKSPEVAVANRIYADGALAIEPDFAKAAPLEQVDFIHQFGDARTKINSWVSDRTKTRIPEIIAPNVLDRDTRVVIVNAIYFKGDWATAFDKSMTRDEVFHGATDQKAPMMHATLAASLGTHGGAQILDLDYRHDSGPETSMTVVLPEANHTLAEVEAVYEKEGLAPFVGSAARESEIDVTLPKMKLTTELELGEALQKMGMPLAFTDAADFSGITRTEPVKIAKVIHKAFVDVNERGTEAAAATAVVGATATAIMRVDSFHADHPFLFFVRDKATGVILFAGRCASPV